MESRGQIAESGISVFVIGELLSSSMYMGLYFNPFLCRSNGVLSLKVFLQLASGRMQMQE